MLMRKETQLYLEECINNAEPKQLTQYNGYVVLMNWYRICSLYANSDLFIII